MAAGGDLQLYKRDTENTQAVSFFPLNLSKPLFIFFFLCFLTPVQATELRIAVATNFSRTATVLAEQFEQQTGHTLRLAFGSTGKHFAQIKHGAPFDVFFAADERRPALLEKEGIAVPDTRFTYAQGRLVLWNPDANRVDAKADVLTTGNFRKLAIANPKLAPYGFAARKCCRHVGRRKNYKHV